MRTLALMEQGLTLSAEGETLTVKRDGKRIEDVRIAEVGQILVFGRITLTPAAIAATLRAGTDVVFLSYRGRYRGRLVGKPSKNIDLRVAQFERLRDPNAALRISQAIVGGKLANQRNLLLRCQRGQKRDDLAETIGALRRLAGQAREAPDVDALRGFEGSAAARYFPALGSCVLQEEFRFRGRSRRPPRDPANAILSFGYTLLGSLMESLVLRSGLEPQLGAFHATSYGRPSLALDLIEEFRPVVVDALMLRLINRREIVREDFEVPPAEFDDAFAADDAHDRRSGASGVWLNETGRRVFFRAWGRRLRQVMLYPPQLRRLTLEEIMRQQVYHLARILQGTEPDYRPFVPR